ncbi:MAG: MBL fold metallo-hydrolase, partial [Actinomycetia bacterium]|nr:MBL fold metallo-hydrolase [Actinomycetes bacterium]
MLPSDLPGESVVPLGPTIHQLLQPIDDVIPLYLHLARGTDAVAVLDGGLPNSAHLIERLIAESAQGLPVRYACNSHPHHDHIGCFGLLRETHGALVVAAEEARAWIADPARNLDEFALHHPHIIGRTPELLADLEPTFTEGCPVDVLVQDSVVLDLGGGVELESFRVDGHLHVELAWYERSSRTLVLGDVVTATGWPIFHGHVDPQALRVSLNRLVNFVREREVTTVAMSHYPARNADVFCAL